MVELKKDELLFYFPYAPAGEYRANQNESIYDVLRQIEGLLWAELSTGGSNRPADVELKLIDYQADISKRKSDFEKMREELSDEMKQRQQSYQQEIQAVIQKHVPQEKLARYQNGGIPWSASDDPKAFSSAYKEVEESYQDLTDRLNEIDEAFRKKMEGVSSVKLPNTETFSRDEFKHLKGQLIRAVRPLLDRALEGEVGTVEKAKAGQQNS